MHVLYEMEASCHRPEVVFSSLRGLPTLKELSTTLRPGLHTPSTRTEGPFVRDDAEAAPVLYLSSSLRFPRSFSLTLSAFAFLFLSLYSPVPLLLFSPRCLWSPVWHASRTPPRPGHRRFSFDVPYDSRAPSFAASRVRFENYPETIFCGNRTIHWAYTRLDSGSRRNLLYYASASWMMKLVLDVYLLSLSFDEPLTCKFPLEQSSLYLSRVMWKFSKRLSSILLNTLISLEDKYCRGIWWGHCHYSLCCTGFILYVFGIFFGAEVWMSTPT